MPKNSEDYWREREEEQRKHNITDEREYRKNLERIYKNMLSEVSDQIYSFYAKYANKEGISMAEAKRRANKLDIEAYAEKAKKYVKEKDFSDQANEEMRIYNLTMKVNRLELLKAQIGLELCAGSDEIEKFMAEQLEGRTLAEIERQAGILGKSIQNNKELAKAIVNASFHNATFSDRIWAEQASLRNQLSTILQNALIAGRHPRDFIPQIRKIFDVTKSQANRLLVTEMARVQTEAQMQSFKRNGFDEYTFLALGTACEVCRKIDGHHFKVETANAGVNMPPMHPHCRCSTSAFMDDDDYNEWLDSYSAHHLNFQDWKDANRSSLLRIENNAVYHNGFGITLRDKYASDEFKLKVLRSHEEFAKKGWQSTEHFNKQLLGRLNSGRIKSKDDIFDTLSKPVNYIDLETHRYVKFYNNIGIVIDDINGYLTTIVPRKTIKKDWVKKL